MVFNSALRGQRPPLSRRQRTPHEINDIIGATGQDWLGRIERSAQDRYTSQAIVPDGTEPEDTAFVFSVRHQVPRIA